MSRGSNQGPSLPTFVDTSLLNATGRPRCASDIALGCSCVDYDEVVAAFFHPSPEGIDRRWWWPAPHRRRRLRDAIEPIAMHSVWSRLTKRRLAGLGLDFLAGYVWGRAAALGEADPGVSCRRSPCSNRGSDGLRAGPDHLLTRRDPWQAAGPSTIESLHDVLGDADVAPIAERLTGLSSVASATRRTPAVRWAGRHRGPRTRSGGCGGLRADAEHRGDGHIAASVAAARSVTMNVITELWVGMPLGSYSAIAAGTPNRSRCGEDLRPGCSRATSSARPGVA